MFAAPGVSANSTVSQPSPLSCSPRLRWSTALAVASTTVCGTGAAATGPASTASGTVKEKTEPRPSSLSSRTSPPIAPTIRRTMARPSPVPS